MRNNKISFFKMIAQLEDLYNEELYPDYARETLRKLISFVKECDYDSSVNRKFISQNYRLSPEEILNLWNSQFPQKQKSIKTIYSQISLYSSDLYTLFGANVGMWFEAKEKNDEMVFKDKLLKVSELIDAMNIANKDNGNIFIAEFEGVLSMAEPAEELKLEDCEEDIVYMKKLLRTEVTEITSKINMSRSAKVRQILRTPLFESIGGGRHRVNHEKIEFLKVFNLMTIKRKPQQVFMHPELQKAMSSVFQLNKSTEVSESNVKKLAELLYQYYTVEGIKEAIEGCNMYELAKAVELVKNGDFK